MGVQYLRIPLLGSLSLFTRTATVLLSVLLATAPAFSQSITMPGWFWQQSSAGFLGPNLVVNTVIGSGYRVFCWQVGQAFAGIAIKADKAVGDVQVADLIEVRPAYCQMILKATNGR